MSIWDDRFGASSGGNMDPDQLRSMVLKRALGTTLNTPPVPSGPVMPTPVQTVPIIPPPGTRSVVGPTDPNAEPFRMPDQPAVDSWRSGATADMMAKVPPVAPPVAVRPGEFPIGGAAPIQNVAAATGPAGITLNTAAIAPGWAGTVGLPASPEEAKGFEKGTKNAELMAGLEQIAKGAKPKSASTDANTITPMSSSISGQGSTQGAQQLMAQMLANRRKNYGISLTG